MFYCDFVQGSSYMLDRSLFNVLCDEIRRVWVYRVMVGMEFQGKFIGVVSV